MVVTRTFRPVVFGDVEHPTMLGWLDHVHGHTCFHDGNVTWPLQANLDAVQLSDLPDAWTKQGVPITILPMETVSGDDAEEAFEKLLERLERLHSPTSIAAA